MSLGLSTRRALLLAVRDQIDAHGGGALHLYGSAMPPAPESMAVSPPLAIVVLALTSCTLDSTDAQMVLVEAVGNVAVAGLPVWARFVDGAGNAVYDCTAGPPGSGAQVIVSDGKATPSAQMYVGGQVTVNAVFVVP